MYYYNPLDRACKSQIGAIARASEITFHIFQDDSGENLSADSCYIELSADDLPRKQYAMKRTDDGFCITLRIHRVGLYFYCFKIGNRYFSCGNLKRGRFTEKPNLWQLTVFDANFSTPEWLKGGVMYQIFPDRFHKFGDLPVPEGKILHKSWGEMPCFRPNEHGKVLNCDFFGGNLRGIEEKLDYLQSLHVSTVYLNPIFEAYSNHRYDTGDYMKIDSLLGTEDDLRSLVLQAKKRGIKLILDGVFNHTGDNSRYFNRYGKYDSVGAYQSKNSPYYGWYHFTDYPNRYESWWGIETLPAVEERSQSYQDFIFGKDGVLKKWLGFGIGGYRLDVADELPDFFLEKLRDSVKEENEDAVIIGEVWEDATNKIAYGQRRQYLHGYELDSVMNYPLKDAIIQFVLSGNTTKFRETIFTLIDHYPKQVLDCLMNVLGTHDTARILNVLCEKRCNNKEEMSKTRLSDEERALGKERMKIAALLQFTLPGVPCIYYGDEIAMEGDIDPFCRKCFDWNAHEEEFTDYYRMLGDIRTKQYPSVFKDGAYREIFADDGFLLYERKSQSNRVLVYVNLSKKDYSLTLEEGYHDLFAKKPCANTYQIQAKSYGILAK